MDVEAEHENEPVRVLLVVCIQVWDNRQTFLYRLSTQKTGSRERRKEKERDREKEKERNPRVDYAKCIWTVDWNQRRSLVTDTATSGERTFAWLNSTFTRYLSRFEYLFFLAVFLYLSLSELSFSFFFLVSFRYGLLKTRQKEINRFWCLWHDDTEPSDLLTLLFHLAATSMFIWFLFIVMTANVLALLLFSQ